MVTKIAPMELMKPMVVTFTHQLVVHPGKEKSTSNAPEMGQFVQFLNLWIIADRVIMKITGDVILVGVLTKTRLAMEFQNVWMEVMKEQVR
jgi:hypothetical protein